jgi:CDP-diglyceride synthetase
MTWWIALVSVVLGLLSWLTWQRVLPAWVLGSFLGAGAGAFLLPFAIWNALSPEARGHGTLVAAPFALVLGVPIGAILGGKLGAAASTALLRRCVRNNSDL